MRIDAHGRLVTPPQAAAQPVAEFGQEEDLQDQVGE
jgi:hypothetical protein